MKLTLIEKREETPDTISFIFEPRESLTWQAGQFLTYKLPHPDMDDRGDERWFTIASAPQDRVIQITTRFNNERSSSFKKALKEMLVGEFIESIAPPEGDFIVTDPTEEMVWIAGGAGITPYRAILRDLDARNLPINVMLLYANRDEHFIFKGELDALAKKHPSFNIRYVVSPEKIDEYMIRGAAHEITKPVFYLSGPEPMAETFEKMLKDMGAPAHHIRTDFFPGYTWP